MEPNVAVAVPAHRLAVWRSGFRFWSSAADAPRERRPTDVVVAVVGLLIVAAISIVATDPNTVDSAVAKAISSFPGLLTWVWSSLYAAALLWAFVLVVVALLTRHRRVLVIEELGAAVIALALGGLVAVMKGSTWGDVWSAFATHDSTTVYPAIRFTVVVAVVAAASPHLARSPRRLGTWLVVLGGLSALILGIDTVLGLIAGLVLGITVAALVHLIAGSPGGNIPLAQLQAQLTDFNVELNDVHYIDEPGHESVAVKADDSEGRPVLVRVYGRDAWQASLLASGWQRLWYRQSPASSVSRTERAEHEAYLTMIAERAGVPVQPILAAGTAWGRDALIARRDDGVSLADADPSSFTPTLAEAAWTALNSLHSAGLAHRDLLSPSLSVVSDTELRITDFDSATQAASDAEQSGDRAHLLVITAVKLGIDQAVTIARAAVGDDSLVAAMPYLQTEAFDADTRREIKHAGWKVADLRTAITTATGHDAPPLQKLRRVTGSSIVMVIALVVVAYVIIGAVAGVGLNTLIEQFQSANWWWVGAAVILAVLIYVGQAIAMQGANVDRLPFVPVLGLETSVAFVGLAVPAPAAKVGLTIRFLQLVGSNPTAAVTISLLDGLAGFAVQVVVIVVTLFTGLVTLTPKTTGGSSIGSSLADINWATVGIVCLILLVVALLTLRFVPKVRRFVVDRTAEGRDSLQVLRSPRKLGQILVGSLLWNVVAALALGCSLHAFGHTASFASLILVNTLAALFAGLIPVPGNVGVAEAAITTGLVAIGVPQAVAMSTAIVYRFATYFVPAIYGFVSLNLMRRKGYL